MRLTRKKRPAPVLRACGWAAALGLCALTAPVWAQAPLSAIDWLEQRGPVSNQPPIVPLSTPLAPALPDEPPVARSVTTPQVTVTPLGAPERGAAGLLPSHVTGLPPTLWKGSAAQTLSDLITALDVSAYPALQSLLYTLLLAEADAPYEEQTAQNKAGASFLRTRVQKLIELGAVEPAASLLARADPAHAQLFDLYFNTALLTGDPDPACRALRQAPALSRDFAPRIFCSARGGDWDTAALALTTGDAIGALDLIDTRLLERFLDPELFEDSPLPPPSQTPSALQFHLFAAIGESLPSSSLPRAFAVTDLGGDSGWKAQAEAAERLARIGAISENRLFGIYTSRVPSASGGVWDRIAAVQRLDQALTSGTPESARAALPGVWRLMRRDGLSVPFARLTAEALLDLPVSTDPEIEDLITRIGLLSPLYERAAQRSTRDPLLRAAQSIATGAPAAQADAPARIKAISRAFDSAAPASPPAALTTLAKEGQLGEALLRALSLAALGSAGDLSALTLALAFFRSTGLEDTARRVSLQVLLSDPAR